MTCVICRNGKVTEGKTTVTLQRGECTVVVRDVPADICDNCGEYYLSEALTEQLYERAEAAVQRGVEVEIMHYAA